MQLDAMDCGPTCLQMVARFYGKTYSLQYLRSRSYITREGVSMLGISDAAESIGFRTKGYRLSWKQLCDEAPLPCIVHWNQRYFIVVYAIKKKKPFFSLPFWESLPVGQTGVGDGVTLVYVTDPAIGLLTYTRDEFLKCWISTQKEGISEGTALLIEPSPAFYSHQDEQGKKPRLDFNRKFSHFFVIFKRELSQKNKNTYPCSEQFRYK